MLGRVRAVHDFGAGASLEIARPEGRSVMVPVHPRDRAQGGSRAGGLVSPWRRPDRGCSDQRRSRRLPSAHDRTPWRATVLTLFPEMFPGPLGYSLAGKALASRDLALETVDIRDSRAINTAPSTTRRSAAGRAW